MNFQRKCIPSAVVILLLILYGCGSSKFIYSEIPANSVYRGESGGGQSIYLLNKMKAGTMLLGDYFYETGYADTDLYTFSSDMEGNVLLHTASYPVNGKLKGGRDNLSLKLSGKKEIKLQYVDSLQVLPEYKERYREKIFGGIVSHKEVEYKRDRGFYTSFPIAQIPNRTLKNLSSELFQTIGRSMGRKREVALNLDIYEPEGDEALRRPVILYLHGGAFYLGDKENTLQSAFMNEFVEKGYVLVSMNYRLGTDIREGTLAVEKAIYTGVQDVRAALRFLIRNSERYRIDPSQIYLAGNSAGGIIALTTAFMDSDEIFLTIHQNWKEYGPLDPPQDKLDAGFRPAGLIAMWGAIVDPAIIDNNPPLPTLLFHGTDDDLVNPGKGLPYKNFFQSYLNHRLGNTVTKLVNTFFLSDWTMFGSEQINRYMQARKLPVEYISFPGYGHEPQENADGSYNENMDILKRETGRFLTRLTLDHYFPASIEGPDILQPYDATPLYRLTNRGGNRVDWFAENGFILSRDESSAKVIWFRNATGPRKLKAYLTDQQGESVKKEVTVR